MEEKVGATSLRIESEGTREQGKCMEKRHELVKNDPSIVETTRNSVPLASKAVYFAATEKADGKVHTALQAELQQVEQERQACNQSICMGANVREKFDLVLGNLVQ